MRILGSLLLFATIVLADLKVYLQQNPIVAGEPAKLVIEASGDDINLPKIDKIGPYPVAGVANTESVVNINGKLTVKKGEILTFYPDSNVTIPPIKAKIDGKVVTSKPIELIVKKASPNNNIRFILKVNKKEAFVGEPIVAQLILKIKRGLNIVDYSFTPPKFDNFWVKELKSSNKYLEEHGDYLVKRVTFLLFPQKSGLLTIAPALFKYAVPSTTTDLFGFAVSAPVWKSVVSNSAKVVVKSLPANVDLVGDFKIVANVDKTQVKAGEPVNFTVKITGVGNIENLDKIPLSIKGATIYEDKPKVLEHYKNGKLFVEFVQKFSIISNQDYTIPAIKIDYFSLKAKKIKTLTTKPIHIHVIGTKAFATVQPKTPQQQVKKVVVASKSKGFDIASFFLGLIAGLFIAFLILVGWKLFTKKPVAFRFSNKKKLLNALLPYIAQSKEAASLAQALYEEIYEGKKHKISKKEVQRVLKDLM